MTAPEILAPAGSMDALIAAVRCGADAVYLGGQTLNARRAAPGFDADALYRAGKLCHAHGAKLYLTLNTLTWDAEMPQVYELLRQSVRARVDALIVQDVGTAQAVRECCDIPLHASTQMSVQTAAGVRALQNLGFVRAVLPRELSLKEIQEIRQSTDMELEIFVHGALCMCVSGQCLMSAVFGSRSGNRGLCAQPCRLPFAAQNGTGHDLSLKDLSLLPHLPALRDMGIQSFKIEGRLKRPEYVAAAVTACKAALRGETEGEVFDDLRSVFARSGFTDGYLTEKTGVSMFGIRQKEDVTAAASPVLSRLQSLYADERPLYPVSFRFVCRADKPIALTAVSGDHKCTVTGDVPTAAKTKPLDQDTAVRQLSKCGGTLFYPERVDADMEDGLFVPAAALNALRRDALHWLLRSVSKRTPHRFMQTEPPVTPHHAAALQIYMRFADPSQIPPECRADKIILPLYCGAEAAAALGACVEIPRALFGREQAVREQLERCRMAGVTQAAFASLDGMALALECSLRPIAFFGSNIANTRALDALQTLGVQASLLSCELPLSAARQLGGTVPRGVWAYGRLPLMLMRNCPQRNGKTCADCGRHGSLTDRKGRTFPIDCRSGCAELLNTVPVYLADKQADLQGLDFALLYFTTETREECARILHVWERGYPPNSEFTRGLAYRGVL